MKSTTWVIGTGDRILLNKFKSFSLYHLLNLDASFDARIEAKKQKESERELRPDSVWWQVWSKKISAYWF